MEQVFQEADKTEVPVQAENADRAKKTEKLNQMKAVFKQTVESDPTFINRLHTLSNSLKVVNSLGYGDNGNIVVDKSKPADAGKRNLKPTSKVVGYMIANIGEEAIAYTTEEWTKNEETGEYQGTVVNKTLAPGEKTAITRKYMTQLCAQPEISFTLSNGIIVASSKKNFRDLDEELSSYYFKFSPDENGNAIQVNDDEVKLSVDVDGVVTPEFEATFGYLNNPKKKKASREKSKTKASVQDLVANYVLSLVKEQGSL